MKVFVQSAGYLQNHGYQWVSYEDGVEKRESPPGILVNYNLPAMDFVLSTSQGEHVVFCNRAPSRRRVDFRDKPINNRLIIVGGRQDYYAMVRVFCHIVLNHEALINTLDDAVASDVLDDERGFTVNFQALGQYTAAKRPEGKIHPASLRGFSYAKDSRDNREKLSAELLSTTCKGEDGVISAVGGHMPPSDLELLRVRRALLDNVDNTESAKFPCVCGDGIRMEAAVIIALAAIAVTTAFVAQILRSKRTGGG